MELTAECGHQVKHSYLISVLERVPSATAFDAYPLVKVVDVLSLGHQCTDCCRSRDSLFMHRRHPLLDPWKAWNVLVIWKLLHTRLGVACSRFLPYLGIVLSIVQRSTAI